MFDLYNNAYGNYGSDPYRHIRMETYGQDFGQTSWVTTEESQEIPQLLDLGSDSSLLEIGCGSGGYALHLAEKSVARSWEWILMNLGSVARKNSHRREPLVREHVSNNATFPKIFLSTTRRLTRPFRTMFCAMFLEDSIYWSRCSVC